MEYLEKYGELAVWGLSGFGFLLFVLIPMMKMILGLDKKKINKDKESQNKLSPSAEKEFTLPVKKKTSREEMIMAAKKDPEAAAELIKEWINKNK
jgi:flagellar biosynthesis/type III secretory pathway M-ring protein FliF/YscJ